MNRALVYGLPTSVAVTVLTLLHWVASRELEGYGLFVEVARVIAFGFLVQHLHGWLDGIVDRFVFRSIHDAEQHLLKVGDGMIFESIASLDRLTCQEPMHALHLASAAVYRSDKDDGAYHLTHASGPAGADALVERDDPLVLQMFASKHAVATRDALSFPFVIRDRVAGFASYGVHLNGSAIDPNERAILGPRTHAALADLDPLRPAR